MFFLCNSINYLPIQKIITFTPHILLLIKKPKNHMKKLLLSGIALSLCFAVSAQNAKIKKPIVGPNVNKAIPIQKAKATEVNLIASPNPTVVSSAKTSAIETNIGNTFYDLQSNYGTSGNRFHRYADGTKAAIWTFDPNGAAGYPGRGTGYNYHDGSIWGPNPTVRQEAIRTGFPQLVGSTINEEGIICHNPDVYQAIRATKGSGAWTESDPSTIVSSWPRAICGGANGRTIHIIANSGVAGNGQAEEMWYWRSQDFGVTYDIAEFKIPQVDATNIYDPTADGYDIDARGDVIAFVCGGFANDLILIKSTDNGTSWTKTVVFEFPVDGSGGPGTPYDDLNSITDVDADGIADTIDCVDSGPTVVIDANNQVHVWVGGMRILDTDPTAAASYFPATDGLYYWNESYGANTVLAHPIAFLEDIDGDGIITLLADDPGLYQCSMTGMQGAGVDASGNLYCAYAGLIENTNSGTATPQTYRDIYFTWSTDGGNTWTVPTRLTQTDFDEEAFVNMAKRVGGTATDMIFHRDGEPGTAVGADADPVGDYSVVYLDGPIVLGINEVDIVKNSISIYPNPVSNFASLNISLEKATTVNVDVVNVLGAIVAQNRYDLNAGENQIAIDATKMNKGLYTVKTTVDSNVYTSTFVKN